ncbi:MAG: transglycosylase SLT domain-containing protein [Deltaproteobacteria bacterium]|uniref:Transglycosylase SLT domain-containing protein n=1 Tax=Candidatus Zymogenus saltonus TaxID=2844893 RepID=A0A9D8KFI1_9DELT|nr:transglycosylase SLT domain-containing protein [Candidatus Zymogenus saltonus]
MKGFFEIMKKARYFILIFLSLILFVVFQFSCVKRISRFQPGDEFLYVLSLMSEKKYDALLIEVDGMNLSSLKEPQANKIAYMAAMAAMKQGKLDTAEIYLKYCLANYREMEDYAVYNLSILYSTTGSYEQALKLGERLLNEHPDSVWNREMTVKIADYLVGIGKPEKALEIYDDFLKSNKKSKQYPIVLFKKGKTLDSMGKMEEAKLIYKSVWLEYPADETAGMAFIALTKIGGLSNITEGELKRRIDTLYDANCYNSALNAITEMPALLGTAKERLKTRSELEFIRAKCYYGKRDYRKASEILNSLVKNNKDLPPKLPYNLLLFWQAKTYDKMDKDGLAISAYLKIYNSGPRNTLADDALYLAARTYEEIKDYDNALLYYKKYLKSYSHSGRIKEVLWYIGWIYYVKGDYKAAEAYFDRMTNSYKGKSEYPQYLYWKARALEEQFKVEEAMAIYRTLIDKYSYTYYNYQAIERLKGMGISVTIRPRSDKFDQNFWSPGLMRYTKFTSDERITSHLKKSLELMSMNMNDLASLELDLIVERCVGDPELLIEVARLLRYSGDYYTPVVIANRYFKNYLDEYIPGENDLYWQMKYPEAYKGEVVKLCKENEIEPAFIYSVMRAESLFQPGVYSWAGAVGLMQIMPATGREIAEGISHEDFEVKDLLDHRTNLKFGVYYLKGLMREFGDDKVLALCGYNAGPGNARKWKKNADPKMEMDEFIENIPYSETRAYVKRILQFYSIYRSLYEGENIIE